MCRSYRNVFRLLSYLVQSLAIYVLLFRYLDQFDSFFNHSGIPGLNFSVAPFHWNYLSFDFFGIISQLKRQSAYLLLCSISLNQGYAVKVQDSPHRLNSSYFYDFFLALLLKTHYLPNSNESLPHLNENLLQKKNDDHLLLKILLMNQISQFYSFPLLFLNSSYSLLNLESQLLSQCPLFQQQETHS